MLKRFRLAARGLFNRSTVEHELDDELRFHVEKQTELYIARGLSPADARMLELLEPFRPQRARVCQVLLATAPGAPRYGPRMPLRSFAHF